VKAGLDTLAEFFLIDLWNFIFQSWVVLLLVVATHLYDCCTLISRLLYSILSWARPIILTRWSPCSGLGTPCAGTERTLDHCKYPPATRPLKRKMNQEIPVYFRQLRFFFATQRHARAYVLYLRSGSNTTWQVSGTPAPARAGSGRVGTVIW
jgi:hypothetical protein